MLALDLMLLVLITICIVYCFILNKRIQDLHNSRIEFARMIKEFDVAVAKADKATASMTELSKENSEQISQLQASLKGAEHISTELNMISGVGGKVAERLENNIATARKLANADLSTPHPGQNLEAEVSRAAEFTEDSKNIEETLGIENILQNIVKDPKHEMQIDYTGYWDTLRKVKKS